MVDDSNKVWGHFRGRGTNHGRFMGHEPTGNTADIEVIAIARFENGKIVEHWGVPDRLEVLMQLGLVPVSAIQELYARGVAR
jgi:predicted ester cyclase